MGSLTHPRLPTIDFSRENLKPGTSSWISTLTEVRGALEEFGCFQALYDTVSLEAHKEMYGAIEDLFKLPRETKMKHVYKDVPLFGYTGPIKGFAVGEGTGIVDAVALENVESFINLMWPEGNPSFCETTYSYIHGLVKLEQIVKRMVFESFGLAKYCDSNIETTDCLFRVMVYRPQENETTGLVEHTDTTFLTILHQNATNGLQLETKDGEWFTLAPSPKSFTVMVGDSFMAWSNGRLHSPRHRVVLDGKKIRYSLGLFAFTNQMVETPQELVNQENPLLFKPFHHLDLLRLSYTAAIGRSTVKDYFGV